MGGHSKSIENFQKIKAVYDPSKNISSNLVTKYELNQIISLRMLHLSKGAKPFVDYDLSKIKSNINWRKVVVEEIKAGVLPFLIKRTLPNGKTEVWRLNDMDFTGVEYLFDD